MSAAPYSIVYSPKAREDLGGIYSYIAFTLLVPETAKNQVDRLRKTVLPLPSSGSSTEVGT